MEQNLLEKLEVPELNKKFPATSARHWPCVRFLNELVLHWGVISAKAASWRVNHCQLSATATTLGIWRPSTRGRWHRHCKRWPDLILQLCHRNCKQWTAPSSSNLCRVCVDRWSNIFGQVSKKPAIKQHCSPATSLNARQSIRHWALMDSGTCF
jgi:hypothetical protein